MLAKMGRPPAAVPRDYKITIRLTKDEKEMLESLCEITQKNKTDVIVTSVREYYEKIK